MVRSAILYGSECLLLDGAQVKKGSIMEVGMLRLTVGVAIKDKVENAYIRGSWGIRDIGAKIDKKG